MKKPFLVLLALALVMIFSSTGMAENPILASLKTQGFEVQEIDDSALDSICGSGVRILFQQPPPSVVWGLKEHHLTYKGWGSINDYRSYAHFGHFYHSEPMKYIENGQERFASGDIWLVNLHGDLNHWSQMHALEIDRHFQLLYGKDNPTPYALRRSFWNRPLTTFNW